MGEVVEVALHRFGQLVALLYPLEPRVQQRREAQVDVGRRVRAAKLHARGLLLTWVEAGNPYEGRAVLAAPGDVDGSLVARYQPLVGVDVLGEDYADLAGVPELSRDERLPVVGKEVLVIRVEESVLTVLEEALVGVHARAVLGSYRLGHEGGVDAMTGGNLFDDRLVSLDLVSHLQGAVKPQVDLVLAVADLVVGVFDVYAKLLQRQDRLTPKARGRVEGGQVEVAAVVERCGRCGVLEVEVLELGAAVEVVKAHLVCPLERPF